MHDGGTAVRSAIATTNRKAVGTAERRYCGERYSASTRPSLTEYQPPLSCERRRSHSPVEKEEPSECCNLARIVQTSGQHLRKRVPRRSPNESRPFSRLFQSREGRTTVKIDLHGFSKSVSSATLKCVVHVQVSRLASPGIFGLCLALSLQVTGGFHHGRHEVSRGPLRSDIAPNLTVRQGCKAQSCLDKGARIIVLCEREMFDAPKRPSELLCILMYFVMMRCDVISFDVAC